MKIVPNLLMATAIASISLASVADACSLVTFKNDLGNTFISRSMEWPGELNAHIAKAPRGHTGPLGYVGIHHGGLFSDGMNEAGVAVSALWLDASDYVEESEQTRDISALGGDILGNAHSVEEALEIVAASTWSTHASELTGGMELSLHFSITDANRSVVVEFANQSVQVYENELGSLTNDPVYPVHTERAEAMINEGFSEDTFNAFDLSPEGRFDRGAAFNATQPSIPTDAEALSRAWAIAGQSDIVPGSQYWRWVNDDPQFSSHLTVADVNNGVYYVRTYDNYNIQKITIEDVNFNGDDVVAIPAFGSEPTYQEFNFSGPNS
ncbi:linear amide C-N hydrolase [Rhodobacteraceae bacterium R_SAG9]|nr:linear amide C-N hydrolase [Rhodobacteraceae bacterium R_SAG9]